MQIDILSLFPEYFSGPFDVSMIKRAKEKGLIEINLINIRDFADNKNKRVDDRPFGGGPGMVLCPKPVVDTIRSVRKQDSYVVYLSPQGSMLNSEKCVELSKKSHLILLCGHYEGVDQRAIDLEVDEEISIGDYILTNGCLPAIVLVDALARYIPGVLGHPEGSEKDSLQNGIFEGPLYTRPEEFENNSIPSILRQGHHAQIEKWRLSQGLEKTKRIRPDLYEEYQREHQSKITKSKEKTCESKSNT